jgi:hypothetical protein
MLGELDFVAKDHTMYILDTKLQKRELDNPSRFAVKCVQNAFEDLGVQMPP